MKKIAIIAGMHAGFLASCAIPGMPRVAFGPDTGAGAAASQNGGVGEAEFKSAATALQNKLGEVSKLGETLLKDAQEGKTTSLEVKAAVDVALKEFSTQMAAYDQRIQDAEQKASRRGGGGAGQLEVKTLGQHLVDSDQFAAVRAAGSQYRGQIRQPVETKALMTVPGVLGETTSLSNSLIPSDRQAMVMLPQRTLRVRDLITPGQTSSNSIEYPVETLFDNKAAPVAEGARKPESTVAFDMQNTGVKTIAHIFKGSRQLLDDAVGLVSYIDGRARFGLRFAEEGQLLYGNGLGQNLKGIIPQASEYDAAFVVPGETPIDRIRLAILQATLALYPATGIVMNDLDWARVEMTKDTQGRYIIGNPQGNISPTLWGLPVATTLAMNATEFLVGAFQMGAQIFDRLAIEVLLSTENEDDFVRNMITIRAEERLALAVYRPQAFVTGTLVDVTP
jgi:HK97 family phage major capsid protein